MKRFLAALTALLVLFLTLFGSACAETGDYVFTFRNGIVWGVSPEEVMAAGGTLDQGPVSEQEHLSIYFGSGYTVAGYDTGLAYVFWDGHLALVSAELLGYENSAEAIESAKTELTAAYNEPNFEDYDAIAEAIKTTGGSIDEERFAQATKFAWKLPDDRTLVLLANPEGEVGVLYLDQRRGATDPGSENVPRNGAADVSFKGKNYHVTLDSMEIENGRLRLVIGGMTESFDIVPGGNGFELQFAATAVPYYGDEALYATDKDIAVGDEFTFSFDRDTLPDRVMLVPTEQGQEPILLWERDAATAGAVIPEELVGTWKGTGKPKNGGPSIELTAVINADGSGEYTFDQGGYHESFPFTITSDESRFSVDIPATSQLGSVGGTWALEGGVLKLDITSTFTRGGSYSYTAECEKVEKGESDTAAPGAKQADGDEKTSAKDPITDIALGMTLQEAMALEPTLSEYKEKRYLCRKEILGTGGELLIYFNSPEGEPTVVSILWEADQTDGNEKATYDALFSALKKNYGEPRLSRDEKNVESIVGGVYDMAQAQWVLNDYAVSCTYIQYHENGLCQIQYKKAIRR